MAKVITRTYTISSKNNNDLLTMFDYVNSHLTIMESNIIKYNEIDDNRRNVIPKEIKKTPQEYVAKFVTITPKIVTTRMIGNICPICIDCYLPGETYHELSSCKHSYHTKCIEKWLTKDLDELSCPVCRQSQYNDPL